MRKIILSSFIIVMSLSLISCNNLSEKESTESNKTNRKELKTYFITTSDEENTPSNWVFGESNENPLEEKEDTNKKENVAAADRNTNKRAENNAEMSTVNNTNTNTSSGNSQAPNNNIVTAPNSEPFNPIDSSANPNDIVSDPYANENEEEDDDVGYNEAEDGNFGNEPE